MCNITHTDNNPTNIPKGLTIMKTICLYFEIHQITHLKRYRFFDIGTDHYYYDDYENERSITHIAQNSYIPALDTLDEMTENAFDDQCTGANPRYPLMSEIKQMYLNAYYGKKHF